MKPKVYMGYTTAYPFYKTIADFEVRLIGFR